MEATQMSINSWISCGTVINGELYGKQNKAAPLHGQFLRT